jgi:polysaccharide deacetylase 2 family uncharacterized protein YibQ
MAKKRRRRSRDKRVGVPLLFLKITLPAIAFFSLLGLSLYFLWDSLSVSPPVYEESYSAGTDLHTKITKIDRALYECLYRNGTLERDVYFLEVGPRSKRGLTWDYTEILVKCPDERHALALEQKLELSLSKLGPKVRLREKKRAGGKVVWRVYADDLFTHKITLAFLPHLTPPPPQTVRPKVAIIIDDLGYDAEIASSLIRLNLGLSLSVLPSAPFTEQIVREGNRQGRELMVHMPMEPKNYPSVKPGPGALLLSMDESEIRRILRHDLKQIAGAKGVNNHMGSSFTEHADKMRIVFEELKKSSMYYVDSRTSGGTVCLDLAREVGLPAAKRNVFLDNDLNPSAIRMQLERLLSIARHSGRAIGIAHPHRETIKVLKEYLPKINKEFDVVPASALVN